MDRNAVDRNAVGRLALLRTRRRRTLKKQDHRTRNLVLILALTVVGLASLLIFAYVVARLDMGSFDNQEIHH